MKKIKRRVVSCAMLVILIFSLFSLCGCYVVNSGKMKNVEGTYLLTKYSTRKDHIEVDGVTLYIVIRADGKGYYAYKDNDTSLYFSPLRCRYTSDTEKSGYYSYVDIDFTGDGEWQTFGIDSRTFEKRLNSSKNVYKGNIFEGTWGVDYTISVGFDRVSKATDLSYIKKALGEADILPYGVSRLSGAYEFNQTLSTNPAFAEAGGGSDISYVYIIFDFQNGKAKAWYATNGSTEVKRAEFDVKLTGSSGVYIAHTEGWDITIHTGGFEGTYVTIATETEVDGVTYDTYIKGIFRANLSPEDIEARIENSVAH